MMNDPMKPSALKFSRTYPMKEGPGFLMDVRGHEYRWRRGGRGHVALVRIGKKLSARDRHRAHVAIRKLTKRQRKKFAQETTKA